MSNFLAIMLVGAGSSYGRAPTADEAVDICTRTAVKDWGTIYEMEGKPGTVNVFDVTGHDELFWDGAGVHPKASPKESLPVLEVRKVTLPTRKEANRRRA